ncbi:GldG family protein [uncultured Thiodictyon sp.]|uniref:GldG family protein n=1 Tax=uncultured Thiodictyon sp. TaxID=1846217 RepID=UPI0025CF8A24|nr:GldG family protein [uncultured Thiodictyon sp.]
MTHWTRPIREAIKGIERPLVDGLFTLLLLACVIAAGWLLARDGQYWDWTGAGTNSLSPESAAILKRLDSPLRATVFIDPQDPLGKAIERLLAPYRRAAPGLKVRFVDPQRFPEQARDAKVSRAGQIMLEYRGRRETLNEVGERALSAAIARLVTTRAPWVAVMEGHGERRIDGDGPRDLGRFGQELKDSGFLLRNLDLTSVTDVPTNTQLALISNPEIELFPREADRLAQYLDRGGNLVWLLDPGPMNGLEPLADLLGIGLLPGTVVDPKAAAFESESDTPAVAVISEFPDDPLGAGLKAPALLPGAVAFATGTAPGWTLTGFLSTGADSWNETGRIEGTISRDEVVGEQAGPLPVVLALTRPLGTEGQVQRVLLVGDGDFLSNAQINAYGNRALGLKLLRWVSGEESLLALPPNPGPAAGLVLNRTRRLLLGLGSLVLLPGLFLTAGLTMRWMRARG